jgi:alkylation response protein AidB-like acyl-CoA dehydrogenase
MDFDLSTADAAFRDEARGWLADHRQQIEETRAFARKAEPKAAFEKLREWERTLYEGGWAGVAWPKEYGGRGASLFQQAIFTEEYALAQAPDRINRLGLGLLGPTLMVYGTDEQKAAHLSKVLACEEIWCQGFSEPGAGSDLASLRTKAVLDGDHYVINGQKVWTSLASYSDWIFLLVRTDPDAPKHRGITYLLVDMHSPGITVRPLVQMTGDRGFNEMFFEDVRVPKKNIVGDKNNGWLVALTSLMYERRARDMTGIVRELVDLAKAVRRNGSSAWDDVSVRQQIVQFACEAWGIKYTALRQLTRQLKGLPPGPESSIQKVAFSELNLRMQKFAMELLGPYSQMLYEAPFAVDNGKWSYRMLAARGMIIGAGTSEIQRNIIGERVLGLPKG